jgi:hypothetical protein
LETNSPPERWATSDINLFIVYKEGIETYRLKFNKKKGRAQLQIKSWQKPGDTLTLTGLYPFRLANWQ